VIDAPALAGALSALLLVVGTGACTATPPAQNTGTLMAADANRSNDRAHAKGVLADQWKRGEKMRVEGEEQITTARRKSAAASQDEEKYAGRAKQARSDRHDAATLRAEGEWKIAESQRLKAEAEGQFTYTPPASSRP